MTRREGPLTCLLGLLGLVLGRDPAEVPTAELLALLRANAVPISPIAESLGLSLHPAWEQALAYESRAVATRSRTAAGVTSGLGALARRVAWGVLVWRAGAEREAELFAPRWALREAARRLTRAGHIPLPRFDTDSTCSLIRIEEGRAVDRVVIHGADLVDIDPGNRSLGRLTAPAAARAVLTRVARHALLRISDLADLDSLGGADALLPLDAEQARALRAITLVRQRLIQGPMALPLQLGPRELGLRAALNHACGRLSRRLPPPCRVAVSGIRGSVRAAHARALTTSLETAGIDVMLVTDRAESDGRVGSRWPRTASAVRAVSGSWRGTLGGRGGVVVFDAHPLEAVAGWRVLVPWLSPRLDLCVRVVVDPTTSGLSNLLAARVRERIDVEGGAPIAANAGRILRNLLVAHAGEVLSHERNGAWRALLPAHVGGLVVLADIEPGTLSALLHTYPNAVVLARDLGDVGQIGRAVLWDGSNLPLKPGALALAVCDDRVGCASRMIKPALREGGGQAAIVSSRRRHHLALYPRPESFARVIRPGCPTTSGRLRGRIGELCAATPAWRLLDRAGLLLETGVPSLAEEVLAALAVDTGAPARFLGLYASSGDGVVLRVRLGAVDAAVRLALTGCGAEQLTRHRSAIETLSPTTSFTGAGVSLPQTLASGTTRGLPWVTEAWHRGRTGPGGAAWRSGARGWRVGQDFAAQLAAQTPTGRVDEGWAHAWSEPMSEFGPELAPTVASALAPLERTAIPTSWCHGDLWPGNIVLGRDSDDGMVIDWENSRPDGPMGIDGLYLETYRLALAGGVTFGTALARLLRDPARLRPPVGCESEWSDPAVRRAFVVAAFVLHALTGTGRRGDASWIRGNIDPIRSALVPG